MTCPLCGENRQDYLFVRFGMSYFRCPGCGLVTAEDTDKKSNVFIEQKDESDAGKESSPYQPSETESNALENYFAIFKGMGLAGNSQVLLVAEHGSQFISEGKTSGFSVINVSDNRSLDKLKSNQTFDAALLVYQLEKTLQPEVILKRVHDHLKPDGLLLVVVPSLDSSAARMFGSAWTEWRPENRVFFNHLTIQQMLWKSGFDRLEVQSDQRAHSMAHMNKRAEDFPQTWLTKMVRGLYRVFPGPLRRMRFSLPSSGLVAIGRKAPASKGQTCSFVVPAYNEARTFRALMSSLLEKSLPEGARKEIVVIESNSTDGTHEMVRDFEKYPEVRVIYQDHPRGKGNAVREGFNSATGEIIVIQDADLEYDLNDLDELLTPLLRYQSTFVLGSRHGGQWKMRQFTDEKGMSTFFNFGHLLFTGLLNLFYGQRLKDPFTMYKIFRRDCLHQLRLEANRFDFDFELVIKLIRKGYCPKEIPINYRSRSFKEGKKVRVFRDPLTWIWALVKYRFAPIYEKSR